AQTNFIYRILLSSAAYVFNKTQAHPPPGLVFTPGGATFTGALVFFFLLLGFGVGRGAGTWPLRRLIRPAALRFHGPTGWVLSLSRWERAGVRASGRIVA
ncbi:hypothetical protein, partial [Enterobacter intestinihominis]